MDNCSQDTLFGSHSSRLHHYYHLISTAPIPANNEREVKKGLKSIETLRDLLLYNNHGDGHFSTRSARIFNTTWTNKLQHMLAYMS